METFGALGASPIHITPPVTQGHPPQNDGVPLAGVQAWDIRGWLKWQCGASPKTLRR